MRAERAIEDCARWPTWKEEGRPAPDPGRWSEERGSDGKPRVDQIWLIESDGVKVERSVMLELVPMRR